MAADMFNAKSVKLAEATKIRLFLPGLTGLWDEDDQEPGPTSTAGDDRAQGEATRKAKKKLQRVRQMVAAATASDAASSEGPLAFVDESDMEDDDSGDEDAAPACGSGRDSRVSLEQGAESDAGLDPASSSQRISNTGSTAPASSSKRISNTGSTAPARRPDQQADAPQTPSQAAGSRRVALWERRPTQSARDRSMPSSPKMEMAPIQPKMFSLDSALGPSSPSGSGGPRTLPSALMPGLLSPTRPSTARADFSAPAPEVAHQPAPSGRQLHASRQSRPWAQPHHHHNHHHLHPHPHHATQLQPDWTETPAAAHSEADQIRRFIASVSERIAAVVSHTPPDAQAAAPHLAALSASPSRPRPSHPDPRHAAASHPGPHPTSGTPPSPAAPHQQGHGMSWASPHHSPGPPSGGLTMAHSRSTYGASSPRGPLASLQHAGSLPATSISSRAAQLRPVLQPGGVGGGVGAGARGRPLVSSARWGRHQSKQGPSYTVMMGSLVMTGKEEGAGGSGARGAW